MHISKERKEEPKTKEKEKQKKSKNKRKTKTKIRKLTVPESTTSLISGSTPSSVASGVTSTI